MLFEWQEWVDWKCTYYLVTNYEALEKLLDFGITAGLRYKAPEHPLLIVEEPYETNEQRKKLAELLFEKLHFPAIYFLKSSSCIGFDMREEVMF